MKAEWKSKWLPALRGGEYLQGKNRLKQSQGFQPQFCCLGVLCDLYDNSKWNFYRNDRGTVVSQYSIGIEKRVGVLPQILLDHTELNDTEMNLLMAMNDQGRSFAEIADYIEVNL